MQSTDGCTCGCTTILLRLALRCRIIDRVEKMAYRWRLELEGMRFGIERHLWLHPLQLPFLMMGMPNAD